MKKADQPSPDETSPDDAPSSRLGVKNRKHPPVTDVAAYIYPAPENGGSKSQLHPANHEMHTFNAHPLPPCREERGIDAQTATYCTSVEHVYKPRDLGGLLFPFLSEGAGLIPAGIRV
jgi:hypothetical protein